MPIWSPTVGFNYSTPANWQGGAIPTTLTDAIFDGTVSNQDCIIDSAVRLSSSCKDFITQGGYSRTITFNQWLFVNGNINIASGTFAGTIGISLTNLTAMSITSAVTFGRQLRTFVPANPATNPVYTFNTNFRVSTFTVANDGGTGNGSVTLAGLFSLFINNDLVQGSHSINANSQVTAVFDGSGAQNWSGGSSFGCSVTINKTAGTLTVTGTVTIVSTTVTASRSKTFLWQSGTIDWGTSTLSLSANSINPILINYSTLTRIANLTLTGNNSPRFELVVNLEVTNLTVTAASGDTSIIPNGGTLINIWGNFTHSAVRSGGGAEYRIRGVGTINMTSYTINPIIINAQGAIIATSIALEGLNSRSGSFQYITAASWTPGSLSLIGYGIPFPIIITPGSNPANRATFTNVLITAGDPNVPNIVEFQNDLLCTNWNIGSVARGIILNGPGNVLVSGNCTRTGGSWLTGTSAIRFVGGVGTAIWGTGNYTIKVSIEKPVQLSSAAGFGIGTVMDIGVGTPATPNPTFSWVVTAGGSITTNSIATAVGNSLTAITFSNWRFYDLILGANDAINIPVACIIERTLRSTGNTTFTGNAGWTTANFIHPGLATVTLGITGTYIVTTNFQMTGTNGTTGRAVLQSDTRADFIGTVNNNILIFTSGTAPFIGGELGMAQSYYIGPPVAAIPQGFAALLPDRPTVISGGPLSFNISPGVNPATGGTFSVGKKAKFFLGTGATQNVIWAATRDIDSLGPGGLYQSIAAQFSFNDSSGITGPTLLRTLNWGTLAPPTRPAAFTFVT